MRKYKKRGRKAGTQIPGIISNNEGVIKALITSYILDAKEQNIKTLGIIRGEELQNNFNENPTLKFASENGMDFHFVSREEYRDKEKAPAGALSIEA